MEWSSLGLARGSLVAAACAAVLAAAGCHHSAAGGRPSDGGVEVMPDLVEKLAPPEVYCAADAAGGGSCPINFCGTPRSVKALQAGEMAELGADDICTPGYVCVPDVATADGAALSERCVLPNTPAVAQGAACAAGAGDMRCKSDALCIESPDFPGMPFCSSLCRSDADCAAGNYCLEYAWPKAPATLPNGSHVNLGYCTPAAKISGKVCTHEADCGADEGCVSYGGRTALLKCAKMPGAKSVGQACGAGAECRSGECFDREFQLPAMGKNTFCTAHCRKNSDCGADQTCTRIVLNNNGTPADPRDDVVTGYCQSLYAPTKDCNNDGDCPAKGGTTCHKKYNVCYTPDVPPGAACATAAACDLGATCATSDDGYPGGYCLTYGCAAGAATGSVDACPGAHGACAQRGTDVPLSACYEGCATSACSRAGESYVCKPPADKPGVAASICLYDRGT